MLDWEQTTECGDYAKNFRPGFERILDVSIQELVQDVLRIIECAGSRQDQGNNDIGIARYSIESP